MYSRNDLIRAGLVLAITFAVFRLSTIHAVFDSRYAMFFSQHLLWNHSISAEGRAFPEVEFDGAKIRHVPYQLLRIGDRIYDFYPPGSALLSMPWVAVFNMIGVSAIDSNGIHDGHGEEVIQAYLAALLMAGLATLVFLTSRLVLSWPWSLILALAAAFGTQVWSTASRAVTSQTWGIFLLGFVIWIIVRAQAKKLPLRPVFLATCLS